LIDTGVVLGPSGVVTQSSGLTILKGTINTPSVAIVGGTLEVDGLIAGASSVTVGSSGRLTGTGIVDPLTTTISSGGTLAPGNAANPTGTLTIAGNLAFQSGAIYLIQATPSAASSTLVNGSASLNGTVQASFASGGYVTKRYNILATTGGLGGSRFSSLANTNLPAGFNDNLTYDSNNVYLNLTAVLGGPGSSLNGNQQSVATGLNNYFNNGGALPPGFFPVFGLTGAPLATVLSRLDGENAADAQKGAFQLMSSFLNMMLDPYSGGGRVNIGGDASGLAPEQDATLRPDIALAYGAMLTKAPPKPQVFDQRWTAWGGAFGGTGNFTVDPVVGSNNVTASDFGFAAGMNYHLSRDNLVGFALAGGGTDWNLAQGLGNGRSDAFQAGICDKAHRGPWYASAALAFANQWFTTNRVAPFGDQLQAKFQGQSVAGRLEAGYRYGLPSTAYLAGITPYAAVQVQNFHAPGYAETDLTGGGFGLASGAMNAIDTRSELGARFDDLTMLGTMPLVLRASGLGA
jgi:uncharacterized protein with beta-barrel porin domain